MIAAADAAPSQEMLPARTTITEATVEVLLALIPWADGIEEHVDEMVTRDSPTRHHVHVMVTNQAAADAVLADMVRDERYQPGRQRPRHRQGRC